MHYIAIQAALSKCRIRTYLRSMTIRVVRDSIGSSESSIFSLLASSLLFAYLLSWPALSSYYSSRGKINPFFCLATFPKYLVKKKCSDFGFFWAKIGQGTQQIHTHLERLRYWGFIIYVL